MEQSSSLIAPPSNWLLLETIIKVWEPTSRWDAHTNCWPVSRKTCTRWGKGGAWCNDAEDDDNVMMMQWGWHLCYRWRPTWQWLNADCLQRPTAPCSPMSLLWNHTPCWWCNPVCSVALPPCSLTLPTSISSSISVSLFFGGLLKQVECFGAEIQSDDEI